MPPERGLSIPFDQRKNQRLRERFDTAIDLLRPLIEQGGEQRGAVFFRALGRLHDSFPDMGQAELEALAVAVMRALNSR